MINSLTDTRISTGFHVCAKKELLTQPQRTISVLSPEKLVI